MRSRSGNPISALVRVLLVCCLCIPVWLVFSPSASTADARPAPGEIGVSRAHDAGAVPSARHAAKQKKHKHKHRHRPHRRPVRPPVPSDPGVGSPTQPPTGSDPGVGSPPQPPAEQAPPVDPPTDTSPIPDSGSIAVPSETFVPLEAGQFPQPAGAACADNSKHIGVPSPAATTISAALAAATTGTTVHVRSGNYTENQGEWFALTMNVANVCLVSDGGPVAISAAGGQAYGLLISADDSVVEGIELRGFSYNISLGDGDRTQRRVTLENVSVSSPAGAGREGVVAYPDHRNLVGQPPVLDGLLMRNVRIEGTDIGISCNAGPCEHWWLDRVSVTGRSGSQDSGADTFAIESGRQIAVVDSVFTTSAADGIDTKATDVLVLRCQVRDASRNGIKLWFGGDVINSVVDGSGADASLVGDGAGRYRYLHNLVTRHDPGGTGYVGTWGYDTNAALQVEFTNTIFAGNATGGLYIDDSGQVSFTNNLFSDPGAKLLDYRGSVTPISAGGLAALQSGGLGSGNVLGSPGFVNRAARDYHTVASSPARNGAAAVSTLGTDLYRNARVAGPRADIGPAESP